MAITGEPLVMRVVDLEDYPLVTRVLVTANAGTPSDYRVVDLLERRWRLRHVLPGPDDLPHPPRYAVLVRVAA